MKNTNNCGCHKCSQNRLKNKSAKDQDPQENSYSPYPFGPAGMIVCNECGNKRCPHASDHSLKCTRSNDPGQAGSIYK